MSQIIDGKAIAQSIKDELTTELQKLASEGLQPGLTVVLVGENPASEIYVNMKAKTAGQLGIRSNVIKLDKDTREEELLDLLNSLNAENSVHGVLVQMPLPPQIDEDKVINAILPEKDVDGFHPVNRGKLVAGQDCFVPCTPLGIQELLIRSDYDPAGKHVVIVGRSKIVGLPLATMLVQKAHGANATVTVCHTGTRNLEKLTSQADILVAAVGKPEVITGSMIKSNAVVIDVGVNRIPDSTTEKGYRIAGDVDFNSAADKVKAITPVPGGVGPMTIAMLMQNTVKAAKQIRASSSTG